MQDCNSDNNAEKNQYRPIPVADTAAIIAINIFMPRAMFFVRFKALMFAAPTVLAFLLRFLDNLCGIICEMNCTGTTISKKKIYAQPWVAPFSPVKLENISVIGDKPKSQISNSISAFNGLTIVITR